MVRSDKLRVLELSTDCVIECGGARYEDEMMDATGKGKPNRTISFKVEGCRLWWANSANPYVHSA